MGDLFGGSETKGTTAKRFAEQVLIDNFFPGAITGSQRGGGEQEGVAGMIYDWMGSTGQDFTSALARPGAPTPVRLNDGSVTSGVYRPLSIQSGINQDPMSGITGQQIEGDALGLLNSIQGRDPVLLRNQSHLNRFGFNRPLTMEELQGMASQQQQQGSTGGATGGSSLLPSISEIGNFQTVFQKYDTGQLGASASDILGKAVNTVMNPVALDTSFLSNVMSQAGSVENLPDPPSLGETTQRVYDDMPQEFRDFTSRILNASTEEAIMEEVDNVSQALTAQAASDAQSFGAQLMGVFASQGVTGGAAQAGMRQIAIETATRTNAQIAQTRLAALDTMLKTRDQAIQTMQSLLAAGQADQAAIVNTRIANLEAQTAIQTAKIQAATQTQNALINAQVQLQAQQLGFLGDMVGQVANQSAMQEQARIDAYKMPYDVLLALATGGGTYSKEKSNPLGSIIGGVASGVGSFLGTKFGV